MAWLIEHLGRPSVRDNDDGSARRNASWPELAWHRENRDWPEGLRTTEWFVDVIFPIEVHWTVFRQHWLDRLRPPPYPPPQARERSINPPPLAGQGREGAGAADVQAPDAVAGQARQ
jgi:hypothetical protein